MCATKCLCQVIFLFLTIPYLASCGPVSSPEISTKPGKPNNNNISPQQQQQQQHKFNNIQDAQLNTLNAYASNYEVISNRQNEDGQFKPSYKLPEMETNFTPIQNGNIVAPSPLGSQSPVIMQYLPQTLNENGVQYLQLIPTRPLMVPIGPYLPGNTAIQTLPYQHHLTPNNNLDYATRPLLSALPVNVPPPMPTPLVDIPAALGLQSYGIQSYAGNISPYKQNHRINRETKDKPLLGPINLNLNEYIPPSNSHQQPTFNMQGRP